MEDPVIIKIKRSFDINGSPAKIPLMNGKKLFTARLAEDGIYVDNLVNQPFLPWEAFSEAINCLKENGGQVKKGNATDSRLGDSNLDLNTMEGHIASKVYGCKIGDSVFKRITPIASILAWAGICENVRGQIRLLSEKEEFHAFGKGEKVSLAHNIGEIKESSEKSSVSMTFDRRDTELRNLETKLTKSLERIKELENQLVSKYEETGGLREELEAKSEKISIFEKSSFDTKEIAKSLEEQLTNDKMELEKVEKFIPERELELEVLQGNNEIKKHDYGPGQREEAIKSMESQPGQNEAIKIFETAIQEKDLELRTLQDKLKAQLAEIGRYESELTENERDRSGLATELTKKIGDISILEGRLSEKEKELEKLEESISIKDKDLQTLAGKFITIDGEIRKVEEKLVGREKKINNLEVALVTSEEKVKKLEKQLSGYKGEENLAVQLREKEELIRQLKGTLASKEEEFSRLNEENRKYKRQQKFESEGLKQIEEQKSSKKWWRHW